MECSKCKSIDRIKNGIVQGVQRYKCKACGYNYTVAFRRGTKPADQKRLALLMYLEGLGFRSIGRILNVHNTTVYRWIRNFGEQVEVIRNDKPVKIMELDELHTYIGHKKTTAGFGLVLVEMTENSLISRLETEGQRRD